MAGGGEDVLRETLEDVNQPRPVVILEQKLVKFLVKSTLRGVYRDNNNKKEVRASTMEQEA